MSTRLFLVLGGAGSGKTAHGLSRAEAMWDNGKFSRLIYLATAHIGDSEMAAKIRRHQDERRAQPWTTIEEPLEIEHTFSTLDGQEIVLLDSLGMWISNVLLARRDTETAISGLISALAQCPAALVLIGDEVGLGLVPDTKLGRNFRDANARLNRQCVGLAERVELVTAGLVQTLKT